MNLTIIFQVVLFIVFACQFHYFTKSSPENDRQVEEYVKLSPETTIISPEKLHDYILNVEHPDAESKARFLEEMGYERDNWTILERNLREQHLSLEASPGNESVYGTKYEIVGPIVGPNGETRWLKSVWMIRIGESVARFVTLIPEKKHDI